MTSRIRVVVGDADYLSREGLVRAVDASKDIEVVSICSTLDALLAATAGDAPDVVVTALRFSLVNGAKDAVELVRELRASDPDLGVLVLGSAADAAQALALFDRAVSRCGFLLRDRIRNAAELTSAIREIARGNSVVDPAAVGTFLNAARASPEPAFASLTPREREVLALLASAESNGAIARRLGITTRAVERHVNSVFRKLGLCGSPDVNRRVQAALSYTQGARERRPQRRRQPSSSP